MVDFRTVITVAIAAIIVYYYLGFWGVFWCVMVGILIAFLSLVYVILSGEGKIKKIKMWFKNLWKGYLKIEVKIFEWIDSL